MARSSPDKTRLSKLKAILIIALGLFLPFAGAMAQEVSWKTLRVQGEGKAALCNPDNVFTSYAGNSAALVFSNFSINLAATSPISDGAEFGACRIVSRITIPKGYYLASLSQSTVAGVVKTVGARGVIQTKLALKTAGVQTDAGFPAFPNIGPDGNAILTKIRFAPKDEMNQPLLVLNGSFVTPLPAVQHICKFSRQTPVTVDMLFRAAITGQRRARGASIIIGIDSSDVQLDIGARLGKCP